MLLVQFTLTFASCSMDLMKQCCARYKFCTSGTEINMAPIDVSEQKALSDSQKDMCE